MKKTMPYNEARKYMTNFSAINCKHRSLFWGLVGHTACIVNRDDQIDCYESTSLNKWSGRSGVQKHPMSTWLKHYNGKVWLREFWYEEEAAAEAFDKQFMEALKGRSYPLISGWDGKWKLIASAVDFHLFGKDIFTYQGEDTGVFCTQLYVARLAYCGFIKGIEAGDLEIALEFAKEWEPDDIRDGKLDKELVNTCGLVSEIRIK